MLALTKPEKKILVTVFSILMALCTMAYMAHKKSQRLITSSAEIEQSEEFKYHLTEVQSIIVDMETGVRGYVMTGDESYLAPTNEAIANVFLHLRELSASPGITTDQRNQIAKLQSLVDEKSTYITRTTELRRQKGMTEAIAFISEGTERKLMDQIRALTGNILKVEDDHLTKVKAENRSVIMHFAVTFYLLLLKVSITVITVIFLCVFYFRRRNKAEKALKESQDLFHNVLDHTSSIVSIKDLAGRYFLVNQAYEKLLGRSTGDVIGRTAHDLFEKPEADKIRETDLEVIRHLQQIKSEEVVVSLGEKHHFASIKFPLFDINNIPYAICSISTDETEKVEAEAQHKEEMKRMLDLFNNAPCGYQATNSDGIIIEINETLLKWIGYTRSEVVGKLSVKSILSAESQHQFSYYFPRLRSGELKSIYDVEAVYQRKDGSKLAIVANSMAQYDEDGNFQYTRTSIFDISYRKRVEEIATHN